MEDTSARWPVTIKIASLKEAISFFKKEMISNKFVLVLFAHAI